MTGEKHAAALPGGHALARRRRPGACRARSTRRRSSGNVDVRERGLHAAVRRGGGSCSTSAAAAPPPAAAARRAGRRCRCATTCGSTRRPRCRCENNTVQHRWRRADLQLRGTFDRPLLFGRAEVDRGEVTFEGRRYVITRGTIDFNNPTRIEPFFDIEAETRVRVPGETYRVTVRADRHARSLHAAASRPIRRCPRSRCWRCCSATSRRARTSSSAGYSTDITPQQQLLRERATRALTGAVSSEVGRVVRADVRRRHVPADAVAASIPTRSRRGSIPAARADDRQAALRPRLPDLLAQPLVVDARSDHPARVRSDGSLLVDPVAQRRRHLRARRPGATRVLTCAARLPPGSCWRIALLRGVLAPPGRSRPSGRVGARSSTRSASSRKAASVTDRRDHRPDRDARRRAAVDARGARDDRAPHEPEPVRGRAGRSGAAGRGGVRLRYRAGAAAPGRSRRVPRHARPVRGRPAPGGRPSASATIPRGGAADERGRALLRSSVPRPRLSRGASVTPRVEETHNPDRATLVFDVEAGPRAADRATCELDADRRRATQRRCSASAGVRARASPTTSRRIDRELAALRATACARAATTRRAPATACASRPDGAALVA